MSVRVSIIDGPLSGTAPVPPGVDGAGAALAFEGIVRPLEEGAPIVALEYQTYDPMAERELERLAEDVLSRHGVLGIAVEHSRGRIFAGECSFRLRIWSAHRKEALAAADEFIDRMKRDVPIWKKPVPPPGSGASHTPAAR